MVYYQSLYQMVYHQSLYHCYNLPKIYYIEGVNKFWLDTLRLTDPVLGSAGYEHQPNCSGRLQHDNVDNYCFNSCTWIQRIRTSCIKWEPLHLSSIEELDGTCTFKYIQIQIQNIHFKQITWGQYKSRQPAKIE